MSELQTIEPAQLIADTQRMETIYKFAEMMATCGPTVPKHLQGSPGDCMAIIMQSMQWGMSPHSVALKTHLVNGTLGYESQLVNAVISSSRAIKGRFKYETQGEGTDGVGVRCGAVINGEEEITWGQWIFKKDQSVQNSPLWKTDPVQQLSYLAVKRWARLYTPDVILGVYTPDELREIDAKPAVRDMGTAQVVSEEKSELDDLLNPQTEAPAPQPEAAPVQQEAPAPEPVKEEKPKKLTKKAADQLLKDFCDRMLVAENMQDLQTIFASGWKALEGMPDHQERLKADYEDQKALLS